MNLYLLDTCTVSDFFCGIGATSRKLHATMPMQIAISVITVMEVQYGFQLNPAAKHRFSASFTALCSAAQIIPFDEEAAQAAAKIRASLKRKGMPIGSFDLLIGSTALAHNRVLVTSNLREFERINGLTVENWR